MTDDSKICPYCAESIKTAAIVCRFCGRDLNGGSAGPISGKSLYAISEVPSRLTKNSDVSLVESGTTSNVSFAELEIAEEFEDTTQIAVQKRLVALEEKWVGCCESVNILQSQIRFATVELKAAQRLSPNYTVGVCIAAVAIVMFGLSIILLLCQLGIAWWGPFGTATVILALCSNLAIWTVKARFADQRQQRISEAEEKLSDAEQQLGDALQSRKKAMTDALQVFADPNQAMALLSGKNESDMATQLWNFLQRLKEKIVHTRIYCQGVFTIMDAPVDVFLDGKLLGSGTVRSGFDINAPLTLGLHTLGLQSTKPMGRRTARIRFSEAGRCQVTVQLKWTKVQHGHILDSTVERSYLY